MSLQTRLSSLITAIGADIKALQNGSLTTNTAQIVSGVKTFASGTLLMRNAAGTITAEPYSNVTPPAALSRPDTLAGAVATPATGFSNEFTPDGRILYLKDDDANVRPVDMSWENIPFASSGVLAVKVGTSRLPIKGGTFQIQTVAAMVNTAPTGASVIIDVNKNGATIFGTQVNRPTIAAAATSATVGAHSTLTVTDGDYLTIDIDQVGSTVAGADLVVIIRMQRII